MSTPYGVASDGSLLETVAQSRLVVDAEKVIRVRGDCAWHVSHDEPDRVYLVLDDLGTMWVVDLPVAIIEAAKLVNVASNREDPA